MVLVPIVLVAAAVLLIYAYFQKGFAYWKHHGILSYPDPKFPLGHVTNLFSAKATNLGIHFEEFYKYFKHMKVKHGGVYMFNTPIFVPVDLNLLREIMTKHFDHFDEKGMFFNEKLQPVTAHLFQIGGARWKRLRVKLSPTFTSGKMKFMFPAALQCTDSLLRSLKEQSLIEIKSTCSRFTTDVIGACAFGIECDSFRNTEFHYYGQRVFATDTLRAFSRSIQFFFPKLAKVFRLLPFPQDCVDFFVNMISDIVRMREEGNYKQRDFMQLLIELKNKPNQSEAITMKEVLSEGWLFFNAGFETSSTTMSYCLYELGKNTPVQQKARDEVKRVLKKYHGKLCYEALADLTYLHQIINETLRLYPPVTIINRQCSDNFQVDGIVIEKGTRIFIPAYAIHKDPHIYENPEEYKPERFDAENAQTRHPYAFLPFGEGPRMCIGMRFAYMQIKLGLANILKYFELTIHPSTPTKLTFDKGFILSPNEKLYLQCHPIEIPIVGLNSNENNE